MIFPARYAGILRERDGYPFDDWPFLRGVIFDEIGRVLERYNESLVGEFEIEWQIATDVLTLEKALRYEVAVAKEVPVG